MTIYRGRFEGRTAVVTGAASGIGRDVARRLVAEGARVSMWDLNASVLAAAAVEVGAAHTQAVDVAEEGAVDAAMRRSIDDLGGRLDILVASAGITGPNGAVRDYAGSDWRKDFDVNVNGAFYCNRAAVRAMEKGGYRRYSGDSDQAAHQECSEDDGGRLTELDALLCVGHGSFQGASCQTDRARGGVCAREPSPAACSWGRSGVDSASSERIGVRVLPKLSFQVFQPIAASPGSWM